MFVSMFNSVTARVVESLKWNGCSEDLHKRSNFPLGFTGSFGNPVGTRGSWRPQVLLSGELQGPAAEQGSVGFLQKIEKAESSTRIQTTSRSLCHRALNDLGPKFNTHLGHSCGTVPAHLGGINIPGGKEKGKKRLSSEHTQR